MGGKNPSNALFIDDNLRNVKAAEELGIKSLHFISAITLKEKMIELELI